MNNREKTFSQEEAKRILEDYSMDEGCSCISQNSVVKKDINYDLDIIIPAYNVESYIISCLNSVFSQKTNYKYRIIIIDDGSTDKTGELIDGFFGANNIMIIHQENRGFSGARNTGLRYLSSKYVMFLDSDDMLPPNTINNMLKAAFENKADIVQGSFYRCDKNGRVYGKYQQKEGKISHDELKGYPWGKIIKSSFFEHIQFPEKYWYEDSVMTQVLYPMINNAYGVESPVYIYRNNPFGITNTALKKHKCLDSLYVTISLDKDRKVLNILDDQEYLDYLLLEAYISFQRIRYAPDAVKKAFFVIYSNWLKDKYDNLSVSKYKILAQAFVNDNYKMFELAVLAQKI